MDPRTRLNELRQEWQPPEELRRSRPREVRLNAGGKALLALSGILLLGSVASGVLLHVKASGDHERRRMILDQGLDVEAQVVRRWATRGDNKRYWVEYSYNVDEEIRRGRETFRRSTWERLTPGSGVWVRYLPSDPRIHMIRGSSGGLMPLWLPYVIAAALVLPAFLVRLPVISERRLLTEGRPAPAVVTRIEKTQHGEVAHYSFSLLSGSIASGKTGPAKKLPPPGSVLCVIYEPDRSTHNKLYPLSLVRTAQPPVPLRNTLGP